MTKSKKLYDFLIDNFNHLKYDAGTGANLEFPNFGLRASDYLSFAEKELEYRTPNSLINCIAHLKRAAECQMDMFIYICKINKLVEKGNISFDSKLKFFSDIGIFSSRTLSRFNKMRNKIEHEYAIPEIGDIEVYYDLVSALVGIIQGFVYILNFGSELDFYIEGDIYRGRFEIKYDYESISMIAGWEVDGVEECISVNLRND
jgi:hypothetical protein